MIKGFGKRIIVIGLSLILGVINVDASCSLNLGQSTKNGTIQTSDNCELMMYCVGYTKKQVLDTKECKVYKITSNSLAQIQSLGDAATDADTLSAKLAAFRGWSEGTRLNNGESINRANLTRLGKEYYDKAINLPKNYTLKPLSGTNFEYRLVSYESSNGRYTANIEVSTTVATPGQLSLKISNGHNILSSNCNGNKCTATIAGPMEECEGAEPTIYVYAAGSQDGYYIPGTPDDNDPGDFYFFDCNGKQNYIGYTTDDRTKGELRPGKDDDGGPGDEKTLVDQGTILIPDKECNCGADYSENFVCDGSGTQTKYLNETKNILGCVTKGKYIDYCGSSIEKTVDIGKSIDEVN